MLANSLETWQRDVFSRLEKHLTSVFEVDDPLMRNIYQKLQFFRVTPNNKERIAKFQSTEQNCDR